MGTTAKVKSIAALHEWKTSLKLFRDETLQLLQVTEHKIRRTEAWLQDRLNYWHHAVEQYGNRVQQSRKELEECREDEDNDCSAEAEALSEAKHCLRHAEMELDNVSKFKAQVSRMVAAYRLQAERLNRELTIEMPRADAFLGRAINDLHRYINDGQLSERANLLESISSSVVDPEEAKQLEDVKATLWESNRGRSILDSINDRGTLVEFGFLPSEYRYIEGKRIKVVAVAEYNPVGNTITINTDFKGKPSNVIAPYLAHEGVHVQYYRGEKKPSLNEEYEAFKAQAEVWTEVKGQEHDRINEQVETMISWGKESAMWHIFSNYGEEYFSDFDDKT